MRSQLRELAKFVAYRMPGLDRLGAPRYPYKVAPAQLAYLCDAITGTKAGGGSILEIGVAKGDTSVFLLEHMRTIGDARPLVLVDTFSGFTTESVEFEVHDRGKTKSDLNAFAYGKEETFARNIRRCGYTNFVTIAGDASRLDYSRFAPIAVVLLDIDLYLPTIQVLDRIEPHMAHPSSIVVDDCVEERPWDGSLQAYREFLGARGMAEVLLGGKGGLITFDQQRHSLRGHDVTIGTVCATPERADLVDGWGSGSASRGILQVDDAAERIVLANERYEGAEPVNLGDGREMTT